MPNVLRDWNVLNPALQTIIPLVALDQRGYPTAKQNTCFFLCLTPGKANLLAREQFRNIVTD